MTNAHHFKDANFDPLDYEFQPGTRIRDLATVDDCSKALFQVEVERTRIVAQINQADAGTHPRPASWRGAAQSALRWKKVAAKAITARAVVLQATVAKQPSTGMTRKAMRRLCILKTIEADIGEDAMLGYVEIARAAHPELFEPVDNKDIGENSI